MKENSVNILEDKEIINMIWKALRLKSLSALAQSVKPFYNISASALHQISRGNNRISRNLADGICQAHPTINYWFVTKGVEPIIKAESENPAEDNAGDNSAINVVTLLIEIRDLLKAIARKP